jgi:hypothetical protein
VSSFAFLMADHVLNRPIVMKAFMILGAIVGFLIGCAFGVAGRSPWPVALWHAGAAALAAAVLARWWSGILSSSFREAIEQRRHSKPPTLTPAKPSSKA